MEFKMNIEFYKKNKLYILLISSFILTFTIQFNEKDLEDISNYFFFEFFTSLIITISIPLINIYLQKLIVKEKKVSIRIIFLLNFIVMIIINFITLKTKEFLLSREGGPESEYLLSNDFGFSFFQYNYSFLVGYILYFINYYIDFFINQNKRIKDRIIVYHRDEILPLKVKNIYMFHVENNITYVFTYKGERYTSNHNLRQVQEELDSKDFFQINRQTILSKESIKSISPHINRKLKVKPKTDIEVELVVSKNKTSNFMKWMEI